MSAHNDETALCARVLDRLVETGDLGGEPTLAEHLGSCVTCFRALTELRDAPRVAEALQAEAPVVPGPDDRFWDQLATRTTAAVEAAVRGADAPKAHAPSSVGEQSVRERGRRSLGARGARVRIISVAATLAAAAAGFILMAHRPAPLPSASPIGSALLATSVRTPAHASLADDATTGEEVDVAELDAGALRRLLERMRPHAPAALTASSGNGSGDAADLLGDDEAPVNEELADLDGDELRRVASSLEAGAF
jgi:hypothetical protein